MNKLLRVICFLLGLVLVIWFGPAKDGDTIAKAASVKETRILTYTSSALTKALPKSSARRSPLAAAVHSENLDERGVFTGKNPPVHYLKKFRGNISAYTNGLSETGKSSRHPLYGITASGHRTKVGYTVAAGRHIPFGTVLYIEGVGYRTVHDRGGAIKGNKIDVFVSSTKQARQFGRQSLDVYVVKWGDGKRKRR
ncbi:3D domain-containing protein [Aneurinibacillus danicus]|jgi:3D (Asp-Asp-Asp) domain-containing protein|uniref:3D domain-containing protein n=1 Tax=Aneurinibacillus danicus TaxID=267746 RepID=A0A511VA11_9BACL|nr:3D domain-containing protein [Aneurinibacillus danicus]GEN35757.1 hypothetical protein ADA01nite_32170 [Aneurinibacillus danicus]